MCRIACNTTLLIRPDDVLRSVRVELVETLRQAQGERFIFHRAGSIGKEIGGVVISQVVPSPRSAVEASLQAGIFGSPTVVVDGEPFWGVETLGLVDQWLDSGGW